MKRSGSRGAFAMTAPHITPSSPYIMNTIPISSHTPLMKYSPKRAPLFTPRSLSFRPQRKVKKAMAPPAMSSTGEQTRYSTVIKTSPNKRQYGKPPYRLVFFIAYSASK